ncbi:DUF2625 domain-containing protein [Brevibacillus sp. 179-C9.3 HS]|uniref:DUF2625 domain-containing protein n=1 Tax=unclassified Brevibacillus TaxID=2684853 RepID=UPI0039A22A57
MKSFEELYCEKDSAIEEIKKWQSGSDRTITLLPVVHEEGKKQLVDLQVSTRSTLGAVAYETGGILIHRGWLRILGSGHSDLPRSIASWNQQCDLNQALLVADDVIGGFFAINGGMFPDSLGGIWYFAPDSLQWEDLEIGYTDFVHWAMTGDIHTFYSTFFWKDWEKDVSKLKGDEMFSIYPFLWSKEASELTMEGCSKKPVPALAIWEMSKKAE